MGGVAGEERAPLSLAPHRSPSPAQVKRMEIASRLWAGGIKAEFGFKPNPKVSERGIGTW